MYHFHHFSHHFSHFSCSNTLTLMIWTPQNLRKDRQCLNLSAKN